MTHTTVPGALREALIDAGCTLGVYDSQGRADAVDLPYVTIVDMVSEVPALVGDKQAHAWRRLVQVDVWTLRSEATSTAAGVVRDLLDGLDLRPYAGTSEAHGLLSSKVVDSRRFEEDEVIHTAITTAIHRLR